MNARSAFLGVITVFVLVLLILNTSCVSPSLLAWNIEKARNNLNHLEVGMTKDEVIGIMGPPYTREMFPDETGQPVEVLVYITQYTDSGPIPDSDKTPICLRNGRLIGWGRNFYDRTQKHDVTIRQR